MIVSIGGDYRMKQQKEERELHRADQFRVGELLKRINADVVS